MKSASKPDFCQCEEQEETLLAGPASVHMPVSAANALMFLKQKLLKRKACSMLSQWQLLCVHLWEEMVTDVVWLLLVVLKCE